jgi:hypothetical protein
MTKFPADAPVRKVVKTLETLGFQTVREKEHISMLRENPDGTKTPCNLRLCLKLLTKKLVSVILSYPEFCIVWKRAAAV